MCIFDITDLCTILPQKESVSILKRFLKFNYTHVVGMIIEAIESSARIALIKNVSIYSNKHYGQIKGNAMRSPFALTFANIFMWHWGPKLFEHQKASNELYAREVDLVDKYLNYTLFRGYSSMIVI